MLFFKLEPSPIWSIGPVLARQWYLDGLRTLDDVRDRKNDIELSHHQEVGSISCSVLLGRRLTGSILSSSVLSIMMVAIPHTVRRLINVLKDLNSRMPREEARDIFQRIKQISRFPENPLQQCIDGFI